MNWLLNCLLPCDKRPFNLPPQVSFLNKDKKAMHRFYRIYTIPLAPALKFVVGLAIVSLNSSICLPGLALAE